MPDEDIAKFINSIEAALAELDNLSEAYQERTDVTVEVLEDLCAYFKRHTPAVEEEPDVVTFAQEVAEGHSRNLSDYIRKLSRTADHDEKTVRRCYEYDWALFQKHLNRYPSLGDLGKRTFGRNNLGVMYLNLLVSEAFVEYLNIKRDAAPEIWEARFKDLDKRFRETLSFKAIVEFERGTGGLWVKDEFSFEAAADNPKGFAGLGRWL